VKKTTTFAGIAALATMMATAAVAATPASNPTEATVLYIKLDSSQKFMPTGLQEIALGGAGKFLLPLVFEKFYFGQDHSAVRISSINVVGPETEVEPSNALPSDARLVIDAGRGQGVERLHLDFTRYVHGALSATFVKDIALTTGTTMQIPIQSNGHRLGLITASVKAVGTQAPVVSH
jgi:hypothetical protein